MGYRIDQRWCKKHGNKCDRNFKIEIGLYLAYLQYNSACLSNGLNIGLFQFSSKISVTLVSMLFTPPLERSGSHTQPHPVETLYRRWLDNEVESLWSMAKSREVKSKVRIKTSSSKSLIDLAVSQARSGMMGKACRVLLSGDISPNNESTWQQLKAKHPNGPTPVAPDILSDPIFLKADFDILSVDHFQKAPQQAILDYGCNIYLMWLPFHFTHLSAPP